MSRVKRRALYRRQPASVSALMPCAGCGGGKDVVMEALEADSGLYGGSFPLCALCRAYYRGMRSAVARDYFLGCLVEQMTLTIGRGWRRVVNAYP